MAKIKIKNKIKNTKSAKNNTKKISKPKLGFKHGRHGHDFVGVGTGVIMVKNGKVLLLYRGDYGEWSIPGGKVEMNESGEACAIREIKEELGIDIKIKRFLCITEVFKPHWVSLVYEAEIIRGTPRIMEPKEHEKLAWFDLDKIPKKHFRPSWMALQIYMQNKNS